MRDSDRYLNFENQYLRLNIYTEYIQSDFKSDWKYPYVYNQSDLKSDWIYTYAYNQSDFKSDWIILISEYSI